MGPEAEVVEERELEPALQVLAGEGEVEAVEAGGLLECSPETLEAGGGEDAVGCGEAVLGAEASRGLVGARGIP